MSSGRFHHFCLKKRAISRSQRPPNAQQSVRVTLGQSCLLLARDERFERHDSNERRVDQILTVTM